MYSMNEFKNMFILLVKELYLKKLQDLQYYDCRN
jgi:hypothetical protein